MAVRGSNPAVLRRVLESATEKALTRAAVAVVNEARSNSRVDTGRLRNSYTFSLRGGSPETMEMRVGSNLEYAEYDEAGTKPHVIRPKSGKALAFKWPGAPSGARKSKKGLYVYASVQHPGTLASNTLKNALNKVFNK